MVKKEWKDPLDDLKEPKKETFQEERKIRQKDNLKELKKEQVKEKEKVSLELRKKERFVVFSNRLHEHTHERLVAVIKRNEKEYDLSIQKFLNMAIEMLLDKFEKEGY